MTYRTCTPSLLIFFCAASLTACVPWKRERAAYADVCETKHELQVAGLPDGGPIHLETYLYDYSARWRDEPFEQVLHVQYPGEKYPRLEFYVQLIAYNEGRQRPASGSARGAAPIPILYDSRQAFITLNDGSRLNARPELYLGGPVYDYPTFAPQQARPSPYDINADEVHSKIPKITNNKHYGSVYVIFPTDTFDAESKWTIHLGNLQVQGQDVAIPPLQLCYQPVKTWIGIEPLMRP